MPGGEARAIGSWPAKVKPRLRFAGLIAKGCAMTKDRTTGGDAATREERLAAKLRENLRRRKSQARDISANPPESDPSLPKPQGER
jgi:hypothetical protein